MLVISKKPTYTYPITLAVPADGGEVKDVVFTIIFHRLGESALQALQKDIEEKGLTNGEFLKTVVAGWGNDVMDDDKKPLPFNTENLDALLDMEGAVPVLMTSFNKSRLEVSEKNLKGLRSPSSEAANQETTS